MVVIWQSPGIEEPEPSAASADAASEAKPAEGGKAAEKHTVRVLEPSTVEKDSELASVVETIKSELAELGEDDTQALAQALRAKLTADFGTIWHVAIGHDFVLEAAEDRRNYVVLTTGKLRVCCFQHEQFKGGIQLDFGKMVATLPYLFLTIMCFGFMTLNSVCKDANPAAHTGFKAVVRDAFCQTDWENNLQYFGGAAMVCLLFSKYNKRVANMKIEKEIKIVEKPKKA
mmetsp:Transcript_91592/g.262389  ORF Transcript_91592/g.262389 Transcript_91592/m.262389 type:complete len:230 (+) Transcript_91592:3-692(+)